MKPYIMKNRLGYSMIMTMLVGTLAMMLTTTAFAKGPKCPCYKDKDLEKLLDKGWVVSWSTQAANKVEIMLIDPENPDYTQKGKFNEKLFVWEGYGDDWTSCHTYENQSKWKGEPYTIQGKSKHMRVGILVDDPNQVECKAILDNVIASLPPA